MSEFNNNRGKILKNKIKILLQFKQVNLKKNLF